MPRVAKATFAKKVKAWRKREGISQSQAAERLGIPVRTLQNWEIARTIPETIAYSAVLKTIDSAPNETERDRQKRRQGAIRILRVIQKIADEKEIPAISRNATEAIRLLKP